MWLVLLLLGFFYIFMLKYLKKAYISHFGILLTTILAKLRYGLGGVIATGESSIVFRIATSTEVLFSQFLSSAVQVSVKMKSNIMPVP